MRRFILWIAAISITFAIGVGADRLWWHFLSAPPSQTKAEPVAVVPQREVVYVPAPAPPPPPPTPPKPHLILDYDSKQLSVWAVFYIMGPQSKEFADIDSIEAELSPESVDYPGNILISTHSGDEYDQANAIFGLVTNQRFFFATEKLGKGDFEYRFDGKFVRTDFDVVAGKQKAVLRGTLTKMKNGLTIAEQEFTFRMDYMGC
jgi:hypothetical protein